MGLTIVWCNGSVSDSRPEGWGSNPPTVTLFCVSNWSKCWNWSTSRICGLVLGSYVKSFGHAPQIWEFRGELHFLRTKNHRYRSISAYRSFRNAEKYPQTVLPLLVYSVNFHVWAKISKIWTRFQISKVYLRENALSTVKINTHSSCSRNFHQTKTRIYRLILNVEQFYFSVSKFGNSYCGIISGRNPKFSIFR